ncbi:MAG: hypothetical protein AAFQ82_25380, partial [Myxococcota bacterium]
MNDEILTREEREAIAEAVRESDAPELLDLTQGERTLRRRVRAINPSVQRFGKSVREVVLRVLGLVDDAPDPLPELVGPGHALHGIVSSPAVMRVSVAGEEVGFVALDTVTCFALVEHKFGTAFGRRTRWNPPARNTLTPIELESIRDVLDRIAKSVEDALTLSAFGDLQVRTRWADVGASAFEGVDIVLLIQVPIQIGSQRGYGTLIGLPEIVDILGGQSMNSDASRAWVVEGVKGSPTDVRAVLGRAGVSLAELVSIQSGDVIWLDSGRT